MADQKLSALPVATTPSGTELIYLVQGGVSKQSTVSAIASTPTLQQVLTAGSTLAGNNTATGIGDLTLGTDDPGVYTSTIKTSGSDILHTSSDGVDTGLFTQKPNNNLFTKSVTALSFIKSGGTSSQFLKADGSVDSTVYGVGNALTSNPLSQFAATTSAQLAGVISDETGSGALVFGTSPTFTTGITTPLINGTSGTLQIGTTDLVNIGNKTTTSQRLVRIGQDTAWIDIGSQSGSTARGAIYINQATPSTTNFALSAHQTAGSTYINGAGGVNILFNGSVQIIYADKLSTFGSGLTNFDFNFASTNGTKLGTSTTQKLSFWNATPIVQPSAVTTVQGLYNAMSSIGLIASGTITLPTGYARSFNNIAINTTGAAAANTDYYYFCTATLTFTLPTAIGNTNTYYIKVTSGTLTINTTSSQTIDGSLTIVTSVANTAFTLISDGTNWQII